MNEKEFKKIKNKVTKWKDLKNLTKKELLTFIDMQHAQVLRMNSEIEYLQSVCYSFKQTQKFILTHNAQFVYDAEEYEEEDIIDKDKHRKDVEGYA
jgi:hypothetical protein